MFLCCTDYLGCRHTHGTGVRVADVAKWLEILTLNHWHMSRCMTKPTKWPVRPAKTQISLGIRPVWPESSLSAWRNLGSLATHLVHSEGSDQSGWTPRLIWVFAGHTGDFLGFIVLWLKSLTYEPCHEKTCLRGFWPGKTQTGLLSYRD